MVIVESYGMWIVFTPDAVDTVRMVGKYIVITLRPLTQFVW